MIETSQQVLVWFLHRDPKDRDKQFVPLPDVKVNDIVNRAIEVEVKNITVKQKKIWVEQVMKELNVLLVERKIPNVLQDKRREYYKELKEYRKESNDHFTNKREEESLAALEKLITLSAAGFDIKMMI